MSTPANVFPVNGINRTSQIVTTVIPPNATFPIFQAGNRFYLRVATNEIEIKPNNGSANSYVQGTGLEVDELNIFANLTLKNRSSEPVVIQLFVGFGNYIDNRLIVSDPSQYRVAYRTSPVAASLNQILIPDLSASEITDQNGNRFLALNRIAIYVSNIDTGLTYSISAANDDTQIVLSVLPATSIVYDASGDFQIKIPSGNINAIVSEIYSGIKPL